MEIKVPPLILNDMITGVGYLEQHPHLHGKWTTCQLTPQGNSFCIWGATVSASLIRTGYVDSWNSHKLMGWYVPQDEMQWCNILYIWYKKYSNGGRPFIYSNDKIDLAEVRKDYRDYIKYINENQLMVE